MQQRLLVVCPYNVWQMILEQENLRRLKQQETCLEAFCCSNSVHGQYKCAYIDLLYIATQQCCPVMHLSQLWRLYKNITLTTNIDGAQARLKSTACEGCIRDNTHPASNMHLTDLFLNLKTVLGTELRCRMMFCDTGVTLVRCCRHVNNLNYKTVQKVIDFWRQTAPLQSSTQTFISDVHSAVNLYGLCSV